MYKRLSAIMFPIVAILLIGAIFWGYKESNDKNSVLIKAENQYQRAFHDLSFHVEQLHTEIGNTIAVNAKSQGFQRKGLVNVWRLTSQAQSEINQLPLALLPFNKTEEFLDHIANFSYRTSVRDLTKEPMTEAETKTLKTLYERSKDISKDLRDVQAKVLNQNLRWMDVELALAQEDENIDNSIIDGFKTVDGKVNEYSEVDWGPSIQQTYEKKTFNTLSGALMNPDQIRKKAAQFLGLKDLSRLKVAENGKGTEYSTYSVTMAQSNQNEDLQIDYTKKGGKLIWFMNNRNVQNKHISKDTAISKGVDFLQNHGYGSMRAVNYDEYQNTASITYVTEKHKILIYPEKLTVRIALDDGDVVGLLAADYLQGHKPRNNISAPAMTVEKAKESLNPEFKISNHDLALIKNELEQEVICHEFSGRINGTQYRIYINGATGMEEKIEVTNQEDPNAARG